MNWRQAVMNWSIWLHDLKSAISWIELPYHINAEGNSWTEGSIHGVSQFMPDRAIHCSPRDNKKCSEKSEHFLYSTKGRNYLLENWGARRAPFKPYFFLSFIRGHRRKNSRWLFFQGCNWNKEKWSVAVPRAHFDYISGRTRGAIHSRERKKKSKNRSAEAERFVVRE